MPIHNSNRIEYTIDSGHISIVTDEGQTVPAYWAHPRVGDKFSGICLLHDWWGAETVTRLLANFFAQMGYYVIAPDMYLGAVANNAQQAIQLYQQSEERRFSAVDTAISVLEHHMRVNKTTATVGIGMGGTLAFEAAIKRDDIEAVVSCSGFPQEFIGQFEDCNTPVLAMYGANDPYIKAPVIQALKNDLAQSKLADKHRVHVLPYIGHDFFSKDPHNETMRIVTKTVVSYILDFLEDHLTQPIHPKKRKY